ncbi:hypothetical protein LPB90_10590 [Chryseobacterium sp. LC2016-29]|uniref:hypothetical protein n=1 Tax=Chryseobacterium sp. LC2016-29 TaxID=2897331 RepID=UPI001E3F11FB|nr:hypothetical protein [Chryseobacterium sp. LC2016-29]MCD0478907.1 hypothetical protein [Chryseobacterium sp. LC2016-29]
MMINLVRPDQTLAELCDELRLENPDYLRDFHNKNCHPTERIEGNNIGGKSILVPTKDQIAEINREVRKNNESFYDFPVNGRFPFVFDLWKGTYQISQTTYLNNEIKNVYEQKIRLDFEMIKNTNYHFQFTAFDFRKNGEASDSKASTLSEMCMETIYPIRITINSQGEIIDAELTKKPKQIASELEKVKEFFEDHFASDYIEKMKKIVEDPKEVSRKFTNTLLNKFLFGSFYQAKLGDWTTSQTYNDFYPWISDTQSICFELQNTLCPKENLDDEFIKIKQKGISCDNRSLEDLFLTDSEYEKDISTSENSIDCEHFAEYLFSRKNYSLQRIEAIFVNFVNENIEKEIFLLERATDNF